MRFGVSNFSWIPYQNKKLFSLMSELGYSYIESVPRKITNDVPIAAIQSIFHATNIDSFNDINSCIGRLIDLINSCKKQSIETIVVGSPTFRVGNKSQLITILKEVDPLAKGISICVEPNARSYGGEYYWTIDQIVDDLSRFTNVKTMLDVGNAIMEHRNIFQDFDKYYEYIDHIHFSAPDSWPIVDYGIYKEFISFIADRYDKKVTYEFLSSENIESNIKLFSSNIIQGR
jgi:sugar phosphate isomerase/epimerase